MGWLQKAAKAVKKTATKNITAIREKGLKGLTLKAATGQDLTQELTGLTTRGKVGTAAQEATKNATDQATKAAADKAAADKAAADKIAADKAAADAAALKVKQQGDANMVIRNAVGLGTPSAQVTDSATPLSTTDPATLALIEAEKKRKAAAALAAGTSVPTTRLG